MLGTITILSKYGIERANRYIIAKNQNIKIKKNPSCIGDRMMVKKPQNELKNKVYS